MTDTQAADGAQASAPAPDTPPPAGHDSAVAAASSFFWPMRLLGRHKRRGVITIYAFCRAVDDIADGDLPPATKQAQLDAWREEVRRAFAGKPQTRLGGLMARTIQRHNLPSQPFHAIIDGMLMDVHGRMAAPSLPTLDLYCRRVAGAVGLLVVAILGERDQRGEQVALPLGRALQLTNILRDLGEDAELGRLYIPREWLIDAEIAGDEPAKVLGDTNLYRVRNRFVSEAQESFTAARLALADLDKPGRLWPAIAMMRIYERLLSRLAVVQAPTRVGAAPSARLGKREKLAIAAGTYLRAKLRPKTLVRT